jgi:hypothetical protein
MAVEAGEIPVIRDIVIGRINYIIRIHAIFHISFDEFIVIIIMLLSMANQAFLVLFSIFKIRIPFFILGCEGSCLQGNT